jgi:anti-sigma regulatory factor (Ser/Thr protein kinase)
MARRTSLVLGTLPVAVTCARRHARRILREWNVPADADTAELLVSELVTNGLEAARATGRNPPVALVLSASRDLLVIEVWDGNPLPPVLHELNDDVPPLDEESGRGLFLVSVLSMSWGWCPTSDPAGKVTWCELQVPAGHSPNGRS